MLPAASAHESVAQSTPIASQLDQERQRIELEYKQVLDPNNPASKVRRDAIPNSADIDREMCRVDRERKQMFDPSNSAVENATSTFPNVLVPEHAGIGIEALAKQYEQGAQARKMGDLMIFTSSTMPTESFKQIVSRANRVKASMVLCGFKNNLLKDTALTIEELGEQSGNVLMSPNTFTKYKVKAVPMMVLARAATIDQVDNEGCVLPDNPVAVAGGVSLDYTLDEVARRTPQSEVAASRYLRQIRGNQ